MTAAMFVLAAGLGAAARLRINQYGWTWISTFATSVLIHVPIMGGATAAVARFRSYPGLEEGLARFEERATR